MEQGVSGASYPAGQWQQQQHHSTGAGAVGPLSGMVPPGGFSGAPALPGSGGSGPEGAMAAMLLKEAQDEIGEAKSGMSVQCCGGSTQPSAASHQGAQSLAALGSLVPLG